MENDHRIYSLRNTDYWGPIFWDFLYLTTMGFPVSLNAEQSREFSNLLQNFHVFLPCAECRMNYKREIVNIDLNITNKNDAIDAVLKLHNRVRNRQNKREFTKNDIITHHFSRATKNFPFSSILIIICLVIIIIKLFL